MVQQTRSLSKAIRDRRIELGLTQEALAERIGDGVRQSDVSRLERDQIQLPRPKRMRAIAQALEMEPGELLVRSGWEGALSDLKDDSFGTDQFNPGISLPTIPRFEADVRPDVAVEVHGRLRQALEDSAHVRAQTLEAMRRAEEAARTWSRHYGADTSRNGSRSSR
jgi:transcriptional regulator with XRE-family HTH domain